MPGAEPTHFERLVQQMPPWRKVLLALLLLALPYALAYLEGIHTTVLNRETWRVAFFPTVIVIYIVAVAPWIWRAEKAVVEGLRPLVGAEIDTYDALAHNAWWRSSLGGWGAFGIGLLFGLLLYISSSTPDLHYWTIRYWAATMLIMYGALVWLIYTALGSARWTALLHGYVLHDDPFDLTPFEPVGRQGLILAMIFVGAITLSLLLIYTRTMFLEWQGIVVYSILVLVTVSIFFIVMWPAHRILLRVKEQKVAGVQRLIGQTFRKLETLAADGVDTQVAATEVQAWLTLEQRLKQTRTWPYDTEMLRTLFISVLTPLFVAIARVVGTYLTEGHF
ncbi:MAG: ABC transporter ATP-binding protein [Caldilineaceae bacterium]|nr:ABC transporter ATP-binding protein [Caldilineaceae bacterium]